ncbi:MAG: hypothetical protein PWP41_1471 [Moorella sp. (in: firmicutes)]|uniref:Uncharacterized protein n=1 Tax=Neomoorella thermoacetica TaxID=1525 RepID=A0A1J5NYF3_NEOTH|nr:hypothetical protein [Moorella sp. (in: firmicutes)]OIQ58395.1 hypothetical protein MOTE_20590 [Moorella thermoacetica]
MELEIRISPKAMEYIKGKSEDITIKLEICGS